MASKGTFVDLGYSCWFAALFCGTGGAEQGGTWDWQHHHEQRWARKAGKEQQEGSENAREFFISLEYFNGKF